MIEVPMNAAQRVRILERCKVDAAFREAVRQRCADPDDGEHFFVNTFGWVEEPRPDGTGGGKPVPMFLWEYQVAIIRRIKTAVATRDDVLIEKARDLGVTWTGVAFAVHGWLFKSSFHVRLGASTKLKTDNRATDSLFGKINFFIEKLPEWLKPAGYRAKVHRTDMRIINPDTQNPLVRGNTLTGETSNRDFARSGRYSFIWFDEAAAWAEFESAWRACSLSTFTRVGVSTPQGMNAWGQMINDPSHAHHKMTLPWEVNPLHTPELRASEEKRIVDPVTIAQEMNLDYTGSSGGLVYPSWKDSLFGVYEYNEKHPLYVSWDAGLDMTALIWWQIDPVTDEVTVLDCYEASERPITFFVPFVTGMMPADPALLRLYDADDMAKITVHSQWRKSLHFGDPSLKQRDVGTGRCPADYLVEQGIYVHVNEQARDYKTRRTSTLELLRGLRVNIPHDGGPVGCEKLDLAMRGAHFPRRANGQYTSEAAAPVHDATSHLRSALEYFAVNKPRRAVMTRLEPTSASKKAYDSLFRR